MGVQGEEQQQRQCPAAAATRPTTPTQQHNNDSHNSSSSTQRERRRPARRIAPLCGLLGLACCMSGVQAFVLPQPLTTNRPRHPSSFLREQQHPPIFRTVLEQQRIRLTPLSAAADDGAAAATATRTTTAAAAPGAILAQAQAQAQAQTAAPPQTTITAAPSRGRPGKDGVPMNPPNKGSGKAPLKGEEEIDLARKMQVRVAYIRVKYLAREALGRDPTHREWAEVLGISDKALAEALTAAADAKTTMIRANMRLVMSIVRRYLSRGVQLKDLLQEGMNGLTRAAEKFDPDRGFKFSTYATWWIKQSVMRAVADQSRVVRLPVHVHDLLNQIGRAERELSAQLGRQPTEAEIAARVDIPQRKLQFLRERTQHTLSMDATRPSGGRKSGSGIGDEVRVSDSISDTEPLQDVKADEAYMREQVERLLDSLNPREADVVKMRYGLVDGQQRTLEEIGVAFRVTRERVRQIEARALHKIKQPYRTHKLRDNGRSVVNSNVVAILGDFAGNMDALSGKSNNGALGEEEMNTPPTSGVGSRGRYRKRGTAKGGLEDEGMLVGAGAGRGRGRGRGMAKVMPTMTAALNETLSSFP